MSLKWPPSPPPAQRVPTMDGKRSLWLALLLAMIALPRAIIEWIKRLVSGNPAGENRSRWGME